MSAYRGRGRLGEWAGDGLSVTALLLVAAWTPAVAAGVLGRLPVPLVGLLVVPAALAALLVLRRAETPPALSLSVTWATIVGGAILCVLVLRRDPYAILAAPAVAASAVACSRYPAAGVLAAFGLTGVHGSLTAFTPFPAPEAIDVLLAGLWLGAIWGYLFGADRRPVWLWPGVVGIAAYVALTAFDVVASGATEIVLFSFRSAAWYIAALLVIAFAPWPPGTRMRIAKGIVLIAFLVGAYAAVRFPLGPAGAEQELALQRTGNSDFTQFIGSFTSNKELAGWSSQVLPFCLAFALLVVGRWRLVALGACTLLAFALIGANTRLQLVAAGGGVAVVLALHAFARAPTGLRLGVTATAVSATAVIGVAAFGLATGFSEASTERYLSILEPRQAKSTQGRLHTWETALREIEDNPWGQGLGSAGGVQQRFGRFATIGGRSLDNSYLKVGLEQGALVMVFFVAAMLALLYGLARRSILAPDRNGAALAIGGAGALTSILVLAAGGLFMDGFTALAAWIMVGLGVAEVSRRGGGERSTPIRTAGPAG